MEIFKAAVQYGDLKGSVAADRADKTDAQIWLKENGHINDDEYVIGISMWAGENHGTHTDPVRVKFLVSPLNGHNNIPEMLKVSKDPLPVKVIRADMSIAEFLALFKRLEITLSNYGLIEGKHYEIT